MRLLVLLALLSCAPAMGQTVAGATPGSFRVTESGAAEYRIPIRVPPGIAGIEPKLTLVYHSNGKNGLFGVGWQLEGLSAITRCARTFAQDGAPGGVTYTSADRFCLDGQRLVVVVGAYASEYAEYRLERDTFAKVRSCGLEGGDGGPSCFEVRTKSGEILQYGYTEDSRIQAQTSGKVRLWALNRVTDRKGNYLSITYTEDNLAAHYRPSRIDYGGNASTSPAVPPNKSVRFEYDDSRNDNVILYQMGGRITQPGRANRINIYHGEALVKSYQLAYAPPVAGRPSRLASIAECDGSSCLPAISLTWTAPPTSYAAPEVSSSTGGTFNPDAGWFQTNLHPRVWPADVNGDGLTDFLGVTDNWIGVLRNNGNGLDANITWQYGQTFHTGWFDTSIHNRVWILDVNADGLPDIVGLVDNAIIAQINVSTPSSVGFGPMQTLWSGQTFNPADGWFNKGIDPRVWPIDVNGDGRVDLLGVTNDLVSVQLNTGSGFAPMQHTHGLTFNPDHGWFHITGGAKVWPADVNGDGLPDLLGVTNDAIYVQLNTGGGTFGPRHPWFSGTTFNPSAGWYNPSSFHTRVWAQDVNGDGLTDLIGIADNAVYVQLSTGIGFTPLQVWHSGQTFNPGDGWFQTALHPLMDGPIDVNGDGLPDLLGITNAGVYVQLNTGSGFTPMQVWWSGAGSIRPDLGWFGTTIGERVWRTDTTGDGLTDIVGITNNLVMVQRAGGATAVRPDLLATINESNGTTITLTHKPLTDKQMYTRYSDVNFPYINTQSPSFYVVAQVLASDGIGGWQSTIYQYAGAKVHLWGYGFVGFRHTISTAPTSIKETTTFLQLAPFTGLPCLVQRDFGAHALSTVANTFRLWRGNGVSESTWGLNTVVAANCTHGGVVGPNPGERFFPYAATTTEAWTDYPSGVGLPTVTTSTDYDAFGNPTSITVSATDSHSKTTTNTFTNDTTNWLLGRLTRSVVHSTSP